MCCVLCAPPTLVCWVCGHYKVEAIANFGLEKTIDGLWESVYPIGAMYRHISASCCIPDYGCTGCCVLLFVVYRACGTRCRLPPACPWLLLSNIFFQPILDVARMEAKTVTKGRLNNHRANGKGKVRLECSAAAQFMHSQTMGGGGVFVGNGGIVLPRCVYMHGKRDG